MENAVRDEEMDIAARALVAAGKGVLAIDESLPTIGRRFVTVGVESTEENRRAWRELLIDVPGSERYISGVILFDETIRQQAADGTPFTWLLQQRSILPGIKVDRGAKSLAGHPGEKVTEGLDGLRERLEEYRSMAAQFAKWRAVIAIGEQEGAALPSDCCISVNAHALARYAALCQEVGLVPVVEPEVLMDGNHDQARCREVTTQVLRAVFAELGLQGVALQHTVLKINMVMPGKDCPRQVSVEQVAEATVQCLRESVPEVVAGVVFLSGGQGPIEATRHLNAMNAAHPELPWPLSFSYGRALQEPALKLWKGKAGQVEAARTALLHREECNSLASLGKYDPSVEDRSASPPA